MSFVQDLESAAPSNTDDRRWIYVPYDQLNDGMGPLEELDPAEAGIVLVETSWKPALRPYHRQKLATLLTAQRHFALEQARRGVAVRYEFDRRPYSEVLRDVIRDLDPGRPLTMMEAAERELRSDLESLTEDGSIEVVPHEGWLSTEEDFTESTGPEPPWRMDRFYRHLRQSSGILMEDGSPAGGRYSHDGDNRERWNEGESPEPPSPPEFEVDDITAEVVDLIERRFERHPGTLRAERIAASRDDVETLWQWALEHCMECFGPYEDAMTTRSRGLFHTQISPQLNLHRILPRQVVEDVLCLEIPLSSKEGFVRQVLGWREFVRHVHRATDGFRRLPGASEDDAPKDASRPGDGGYAQWAGQPWIGADEGDEDDEKHSDDLGAGFGGSLISRQEADADLPPAFWGEPSGLHCLDQVVESVWDEGWSHHITRLMILSNLATLLDISPRQLTDWFWVAYVDAYDWVVEPNVLGMGTFAVGGIMTTKPYVSGAAYIHKMSDYCADCAFNPRTNCPITRMYWAYLGRHAEREQFQDNRRLALPLASLRKRSDDKRREDERVAGLVQEALASGRRLAPDDLE